MISIKSYSFSLNNQLRHLFTYNKLSHELTDNKYKSVRHKKSEELTDGNDNESSSKNNKNNNKSSNQDKRQINNNISSRKLESPQQYCMNCVKKYDYENFLSTLLLKDSSLRRSAFAIRALNAELSQTRDLTSTQLMAQIRLQFWSDLIDQMYSAQTAISAANQPIAYEIQRCGNNGKLGKHWFKKLIETRMNAVNLSDFPFKTINELEQYCDSTVSPVYYLIIESSLNLYENEPPPNQRILLDHIASHLGRGQGLTNILRGVSHNARHNRCYIPSDLLVKYKTSHENFLRANEMQSVKDVCFEVASIANQHIETANSLIKQIKRDERLIFLPLVSVKSYLSRLEKYDFNIFDPKLTLRQGLLPFTLWFKSKTI